MRKEIFGWVISIQPDSENDKQVTENCGTEKIAWLALGPPEVHNLKCATQKKEETFKDQCILKPQRRSEGHKALRTL